MRELTQKRGQAADTSAADLLDGFEGDHRQLIVERRLQLVVPGNRKITLGLDDEEARGHPHLEAFLLRIEPLD